jgi:putrescine transport system permease protein
MRIYSQVRLGVTPEINAASTLMIALVAGLLVAAALVGKARSTFSGFPRTKRLPSGA